MRATQVSTAAMNSVMSASSQIAQRRCTWVLSEIGGHMAERFKIAIVGSGPGGLSAAARAAERGESHVLLEAEENLSNTIFRYQKGKFVMDEPGVLPLRSPIAFKAGSRESILGGWNEAAQRLKVNVRHKHEVSAIKPVPGGGFELKC